MQMMNQISNHTQLTPAQQAQLMQQMQGVNPIDGSSAVQMQGEMAIAKTEPLESNPELGIYFFPDHQDGDGSREVYFTQFNRRQRLLVTAGSSYMAKLWDLRSDDYNNFKSDSLPHIKSANALNDNTAEVSSVHWNTKGDRLLTSSSDMVARVWKVEESGEVKIEKVKNFTGILMNSKFNNSE